MTIHLENHDNGVLQVTMDNATVNALNIDDTFEIAEGERE